MKRQQVAAQVWGLILRRHNHSKPFVISEYIQKCSPHPAHNQLNTFVKHGIACTLHQNHILINSPNGTCNFSFSYNQVCNSTNLGICTIKQVHSTDWHWICVCNLVRKIPKRASVTAIWHLQFSTEYLYWIIMLGTHHSHYTVLYKYLNH